MVITGIGMLSSFADSKDTLYEALKRGENSAGNAELPKLERSRKLLFSDSITKKSYAAFERALSDSKTELNSEAGMFLGNTFGSMKSLSDFEWLVIEKNYKAAMPADFVNTVMTVPAGQLAIIYGLEGMNVTTATGTRASIDSLIYCGDMIDSGRVNAAAVGGVEEGEPPYLQFIKHHGGEPSDGICIFIAETRESAEKRNAHIYAELIGGAVGYKQDFDEGDVRSVMEKAVKNAGISFDDIDFVISSGNAAEKNVISENSIDCIDIKSVIGETHSSAGAFAAAAAIAVMENGALPNGKKIKKRTTAMINSFGFDGYMGCIILRGD